MKPVKRVLLGSAAGVFTVAGAQAADLPVTAKPVEYVRVCSVFGAGFWYVPGTDTCIKIGSFVKFQVVYNMSSTGPFMLGASAGGAGSIDAGGRNTRTDTSPFTIAGRFMGMSFDLRTQTEYGTLRSYADILASGAGSTDAWNSGANQQNAQTVVNTRAFIQFAGFTIGRMRSFFDMYAPPTLSGGGIGRFGADTAPNGINGIAYTWQFGGGLAASASLEDNSGASNSRGRTIVNTALNPFAIASPATVDDKGIEFLDPVVNLRLDQRWGFVGVSGALHDASAGYYGSVEGSGHPGDVFGWAASPAFLITDAFGLPGDIVAGQAVLAKGATGYAIAGQTETAFFRGQNLGFGIVADGVYGPPGSSVDLTTVWSFNGAYEHRWTPQWRTSVYGGMFGVRYDDAAAALICSSLARSRNLSFGTVSVAGTSGGCSPNWGMAGAGTRTLWNPVPDVDVAFDVVWYHINTSFAGAVVNLPNGAGAKPSGLYSVSNQDSLGAVFRIQRNFLY